METMDIDEEEKEDDVKMDINANIASYDKNIYQPPLIIPSPIKRKDPPPLQPILSNTPNLHKWKYDKKDKQVINDEIKQQKQKGYISKDHISNKLAKMVPNSLCSFETDNINKKIY